MRDQVPYRREPASHGTGFRCTRVSAPRTGSVPSSGPSRSVACGKISSVAVIKHDSFDTHDRQSIVNDGDDYHWKKAISETLSGTIPVEFPTVRAYLLSYEEVRVDRFSRFILQDYS